MTDIERLEERLSAVERTVIDGEHDFEELADLAEVADRLERLEDGFEELERRIADLEGRTDSLQGYVTNVDSVNESVEQQSASALAAVESLEERVEELERRSETTERVDQYRPTSRSQTTEQPIEEDSIAETVDRLVEGTDRERRPGAVAGAAGDGTTAVGQTDGGSASAPARAADSSDDPHADTPEADPDEIDRRYGERPDPVPDSEITADETDETGSDDDSFLSSLKSTFS
ncbi:DUF7310 family coiled-coil domain-containing protein [Halapricum desulfuricans]|uniref:Putative pilin/flagellin, contains class III signal peptide n=1 Tax=Halapricum desulfuricans TaxID=2841257 RepID=A0A897N3E3_9EURY|nr:hypothetical protein [Halapricum desulfuricans]QSG07011.1 putative pilin/flagellin, contains class III signal peptide [Halapricum desulfuricans]